MNGKLTRPQRKRAKRLFDLAATRVDQSLGRRVRDASTVRSLDAEEPVWFTQSLGDGDCAIHARADSGSDVKRANDTAPDSVQACAIEPQPCFACGGQGCSEPDYFGNRDPCDRCEGSGIEGGPDARADEHRQ